MLRNKIRKRDYGITYVYLFKLKIWIESSMLNLIRIL